MSSQVRDVPIGIKILQKLTEKCCRSTYFNRNLWYRSSVWILTFLAYTGYHSARKTLSVVKTTLHRNCSELIPPSDVNATVDPDWCDWKPFDGPDSSRLLGALDSSFLFAYAGAMFLSGIVAERVNLRYFLALGMIFSGIACYLLGIAKTYGIHSLLYFILVQVFGGIVQTTGWPGVVAVMGNWFGKEKRGLIMGIWNSHTSIGNIVGTLIAGRYLETDWSLSFIVPGLLIAIIGFLTFLFLVTDPADVGCTQPNRSNHTDKSSKVDRKVDQKRKVKYYNKNRNDKSASLSVCNRNVTGGGDRGSGGGLCGTAAECNNLLKTDDVDKSDDLAATASLITSSSSAASPNNPVATVDTCDSKNNSDKGGKEIICIQERLAGDSLNANTTSGYRRIPAPSLNADFSECAEDEYNDNENNSSDSELLPSYCEDIKRVGNEGHPILSASGPEKAVGFFGALCIPGVVEFSLCLFFAKLVSYTFLYWLPLYIKSSTDLTATMSADLSTVFDVGGIVGGIIAGMISDYSGMSATTCAGMLLLAIPVLFVYYLYGAGSIILNLILLSLTGILVNGPYALITTAVSAELGTHHSLSGNSKALATVTAIIDGTGSIGAAVGPLLAGLVSSESWEYVFYLLMLSDLCALVLLVRLVGREIKHLSSVNYPGWTP